MKPSRSLMWLALALPLAVSCDHAKVHASKALDSASVALAELAEEVEALDLSALSPEAIPAKGKEFADAAAVKLTEIKDSETAQKVVDGLQPVIDKLIDAKEVIGEKMPTMAELKEAARELEQKVAGDEGLMGIVQPLLDKIDALYE